MFDLRDRTVIDLSRALSSAGRIVELYTRVWSLDRRRLAVEIAAEGYNGGRDLAATTIAPFGAVEYVGSMRGSLPLWTTRDYGWVGRTSDRAAHRHQRAD